MSVTAEGCVLCELEQALRSRSSEIRDALRVMNPVTDPYYAGTFQVLIEVDRDLGTLKGRFRKQRNANVIGEGGSDLSRSRLPIAIRRARENSSPQEADSDETSMHVRRGRLPAAPTPSSARR